MKKSETRNYKIFTIKNGDKFRIQKRRYYNFNLEKEFKSIIKPKWFQLFKKTTFEYYWGSCTDDGNEVYWHILPTGFIQTNNELQTTFKTEEQVINYIVNIENNILCTQE